MTEPKKSKKSQTKPQKPDKVRPKLAYLTAKQAVCLSSILLHPTDEKAIGSLGWSRAKFYRVKIQVKHLKAEYAQEISEDTIIALSLAGKHAVSKYIELLSKGSRDFQKVVADEIMDRVGIIKKTPEDKPAAPMVQAIIAQKVERYGGETD